MAALVIPLLSAKTEENAEKSITKVRVNAKRREKCLLSSIFISYTIPFFCSSMYFLSLSAGNAENEKLRTKPR